MIRERQLIKDRNAKETFRHDLEQQNRKEAHMKIFPSPELRTAPASVTGTVSNPVP